MQPRTLNEALEMLADGAATVAAGCTDLFPATEHQVLRGPVLDITRVAGLRGISAGPDGWRFGAATTWSDVIGADLPPAFDMLKQAAREVGSVQIQNAGTIAGNLCNASPAADGVPPLMALDAAVELVSSRGSRRIALGDFLTGPRQTALAPGELLGAVHVPRAAGTGASRFLKLGARRYLVISIAIVAVRLEARGGRVTDIAISVGACSPVARRVPGLEASLVGRPVARLADAVPAGALDRVLSPIGDVRGTPEYRGEAARWLVTRALTELTKQESPG